MYKLSSIVYYYAWQKIRILLCTVALRVTIKFFHRNFIYKNIHSTLNIICFIYTFIVYDYREMKTYFELLLKVRQIMFSTLYTIKTINKNIFLYLVSCIVFLFNSKIRIFNFLYIRKNLILVNFIHIYLITKRFQEWIQNILAIKPETYLLISALT